MDIRKKKILQAIIQDYITSAEPVGSRTIARKYDLGVSAATIRNEMFDLEMLGYLEQPHTSAGRVPSIKGYRFYVDCLLEPMKISSAEQNYVKAWFQNKSQSVDDVFQETAKLLSNMTHNVTLALSGSQIDAKFNYLKFLPLDEVRSILVIVTDRGHIENCIFYRPENVTNEDLNMVSEKLNRFLKDVPIGKIDYDLIEKFRTNVVDDADLYRLAFHSLQKSFHPKRQVYTGGTTELLNKPEFQDIGKARNLFSLLEEDDVITSLLYSDSADELSIKIGEENEPSPIKDCSIIQATFKSEDRVLGKIAILGPTRMEYAKILGLLHFMQTHITKVLKHYEDQ
jgi:heat-inducible transcriptional repressor